MNENTKTRAALLFLSPALIAIGLFFFIPVIAALILSFSDFDIYALGSFSNARFVGFGNYIKLFEDPLFWLALKNNVYIVLISVFGQLPLGFIFAYLIYRKIVRFGAFWQGVLYMPAIISTIVRILG